MRQVILFIILLSFVLMTSFLIPQGAGGEEPKAFVPDKALCAEMLRFGKQAYLRGKYLDAKEYFRKAVQADPSSSVAWRYYDLATIFALAEKVEKNTNLIAPGVSTRAEPAPGTTPAPPAPAPQAQQPPKKEPGFKILEDEGC